MDVCLLCVLLGRGLCDELITRLKGPTDCGASLCVIRKPRGRGGHSPRWSAEPEKIITRCVLGYTMSSGISTCETTNSCHYCCQQKDIFRAVAVSLFSISLNVPQ
jgi:hypothetical protein